MVMRIYSLLKAPLLVTFLLIYFSPYSEALSCKSLLLKQHYPRQTALEKPKNSFRLLSYNVNSLEEYLGKYKWNEDGSKMIRTTDDYSGLKQDGHRSQIESIIKQMNPDILVLQEVESMDSLQRFAKNRLNDAYTPFNIQSNDSRGITTAVLISDNNNYYIRKNTYDHLRWTSPSGIEEPIFTRSAALIEIYDPFTKKIKLALFPVHLKSMRDRAGDPDSKLKRRTEIDALQKIIQRYKTENPLTPFIIIGDFNAPKELGETFQLKNKLNAYDPFDDTQVYVDDTKLGKATHTYHPEKGSVKAGELDYALIDPSLQEFTLKSGVYRYTFNDGSIRPLPNSQKDRNLNPSDHFPIYIDLDSSFLN